MNFQHLKYAVEVERSGSITQAAENLFMGQPNLSKAIRELESNVGITIFERSPKGVVPTKKGLVFLGYAKAILRQVDEMETLYRPGGDDDISLRLSAPRASYIAYAFTRFVNGLAPELNLDISFKETNSVAAINDVAQGDSRLAIIRFQADQEEYFVRFLEDKGLVMQSIWEFQYLALMSRDNPLGRQDAIRYADLSDGVEILHGDIMVPFQPVTDLLSAQPNLRAKKRIYVYERGSQFDLLASVPSAYMWVSALPEPVLTRYGLVQRRCQDADQKFSDALIFPRNAKFTPLDEAFISEVKAVQQCLEGR